MENGEFQKHILITGATGFLGSSLAASFLDRGCSIVALSRNDPHGTRTQSAIESAAAGFQITLAPNWRARVTVIECDFTSLEKFKNQLSRPDVCETLARVSTVWNCAAQMSYSPKKLSESVLQNVGITTLLYKHFHDNQVQNRSIACRFFHVSTAYTAGMQGGDVREELHTHPLLINGYQTSKWGAELALAHLFHEQGQTIPVTIVRPTIIMGHRETGWSNGHPFGFYMFVEALRRAKLTGAQCIRIDVDPKQKPNVIPIEEVVAAATTLTAREKSRNFEIFHIGNRKSLTTRDFIDTMAEAAGVEVKYEKPLTLIDRQIDKGITWNREFASTTWNFETEKLESALGDVIEFCEKPLTPTEVRRACDHYLGNHSQAHPKADFFTAALGLATRIEAATRPLLRRDFRGFARALNSRR